MRLGMFDRGIEAQGLPQGIPWKGAIGGFDELGCGQARRIVSDKCIEILVNETIETSAITRRQRSTWIARSAIGNSCKNDHDR